MSISDNEMVKVNIEIVFYCLKVDGNVAFLQYNFIIWAEFLVRFFSYDKFCRCAEIILHQNKTGFNTS
jgi:hypothetical protein